MGSVSGNQVTGTVKSIHSNTHKNQSTVTVNAQIESNRFENGNLSIADSNFKVIKNTKNAVIVQGIVNAPDQAAFTLVDDDDYDENSNPDEGQDIEELPKTFSLMQYSDDRDKNIFAEAYIIPKYDGYISGYNNGSIAFALNVDARSSAAKNQLNLGINSNGSESDDFWVAYVQLAYQPGTRYDNDPDSEREAHGGVTIWDGAVKAVDDVTKAAEVPTGGWGSLLFLETMRDFYSETVIDFRERSAPHEVGHQFGLKGDDKKNEFGIMSEDGSDEFVPRHRNVMRWRVKSPGN